MKTALFNHFTLRLSKLAIEDCSHSGQCDADIDYWHMRTSFDHITDDDLVAELKETGAWTIDELQDRETNEKRLLWIAACNIAEEEKQTT